MGRGYRDIPTGTLPYGSLSVKGSLYIGVADRTGLEPATSGVTGRHSNQLNYRS